MGEQQNLREWTRIDLALDVLLRFDDGAAMTGTTRNISASGMLIETDSIAETAAECEVTLKREDGESSITIQGRGEVVRTDGSAIAIHLTLLHGEESYTNLRSLIIHNAGDDAAKAKREFQEHIGLERPQR